MDTTKRRNNFDFLRFLAALYVIIKHSFDLLDETFSPQEILKGAVAVPVFFLISGFLITGSAISSKSIKNYLWKRIIRIYPALITVILLSVFVLGPILTVLSTSEYFTSTKTYLYLVSTSIFKLFYHLPGVFENNLIKGVNGSLWTLPYELILYIATIVLVSIPLLNKKKNLLLVLLILFFTVRIILGHRLYWFNYSTPLLLNFNIMYLFDWTFYFLLGAVIFKYKYLIQFKLSISIILTLAYSATIIFEYVNIASILHYVTLTYLVFYFSNLKSPLNSFGKYGDFSYGLYIYAFPVQQILINYFPEIEVLSLIIMTTLISLGFAFLSWNYIEERALIYKNKFL